MPEITIHIFPASDEGFMYTIWLGDPEVAVYDADGFDGGQCTTTFENALEMATEQAHAAWNSRQDLPESQR